MERSRGLTKIKKFKHKEYFNNHVVELLTHFYPEAELRGSTIKFTDGMFKGLSCTIFADAIYPNMDDDFRERFPKFKRNGYHSFEELVNTGVKWTGSSGLGYMYPKDRNQWDDSPLGMEQKAAFFVIAMQVCLTWMIRQNNLD